MLGATGSDLEVFAQFGLGGLAFGLVWVLGKWVLSRAESDRLELQALNLWIREKGLTTMASNEATTNKAVELVERQAEIIDRLVADRPSRSRRPAS